MVKIERIILTEFESNCYIVWQRNKTYCIIIDPGGEVHKINKFLNKNNLSPEAILLTHGHIDHIGGCSHFEKIPVYINEYERDFLTHPELNLSIFSPQVTRFNNGKIHTFKDGEILYFPFSELKFKVIHTPGHTPGSSCFLISGVVFSGDTLFREGVGRTDLPQASWEMLKRSLQEKLFLLPDETRVYPGHGEETDIGYEKFHNPF